MSVVTHQVSVYSIEDIPPIEDNGVRIRYLSVGGVERGISMVSWRAVWRKWG